MKYWRSALHWVFWTCLPVFLQGQTVYFFQDSNNPGYYDSGLAFKTSPSLLAQSGSSGDKIPVDYNTYYQGTNALKLNWTSKSGGDWAALVIAPGFPFQDVTGTDTLAFWAYSKEGLEAAHWPLLYFEGAPGTTKSRRYALSGLLSTLPAGVWTHIKLPLSLFRTDPNQTNIDFSKIKAVIFGQDAADGQEHTLYLDDVKTYRAESGLLAPPTNLRARGYDSHVELRWQAPAGRKPAGYRIWRSGDGGTTFEAIRLASADTIFIDFTGYLDQEKHYFYKVTSVDDAGQDSESSNTELAVTRPFSDEELMEMVQQYTFRYFWDFAHPVSGLARERNTSGNTVTSGGSGFGIMAILVAVERGWITREQGLTRLNKMVVFLSGADRFKGAWSHWLDGSTGKVIPFSAQDNGGDIVETAFLIQGLLTARQYFSSVDPAETALRDRITQLWEAVDWNWYRQLVNNVITWHWSPNFNFAINHSIRGFNETMIVYLLAIASPTHPVPATLYQTGWAGGNYRNGNSYYGFKLDVGPAMGGPLFFAHYSYLGFAPRNIRDAYTNYFERNRNHALIHQEYCRVNPQKHSGYSAECWGLTASDNPFGYLAHEPANNRDNGTIAPTAALASMPYTPEASMAALKHFYREHGERLWGWMGFYDAFNLNQNWFAGSYLAIDQGPIIDMIENHRSGLLWRNFMADPEMQRGVQLAGFSADTVSTGIRTAVETIQTAVFPNPGSNGLLLEWDHPGGPVQIQLLSMEGRTLRSLWRANHLAAGPVRKEIDTENLPRGVYLIKVQTESGLGTVRWIKSE